MLQLFPFFIEILPWLNFASHLHREDPRNHRALESASFSCPREVSDREGLYELIPGEGVSQLM